MPSSPRHSPTIRAHGVENHDDAEKDPEQRTQETEDQSTCFRKRKNGSTGQFWIIMDDLRLNLKMCVCVFGEDELYWPEFLNNFGGTLI